VGDGVHGADTVVGRRAVIDCRMTSLDRAQSAPISTAAQTGPAASSTAQSGATIKRSVPLVFEWLLLQQRQHQ